MSIAIAPALERSTGSVYVSFKTRLTGTMLDGLYQQGCSKVRFPRKRDGIPEAILMNTAGGLADGDSLNIEFRWRSNTRAVVTTQAAERVYRAASSDAARVTTRLRVDAGAVAAWIPQETIIFNGSRLARSLEIDLSSSGRLLALESLVFGRRAMGETVSRGLVSDRWRVRIGTRLAFADHFLLDNAITGPIDNALASAPVANGAHCIATLLVVGPDCDRIVTAARKTKVESSSESLTGSRVNIGATALDGLAILRVVAADSAAMRDVLIRIFALAAQTSGIPLPRVWHC